MKNLLAIDFDGVLHSYTSGWQGADIIPDLPVPGAIEWLTKILEDGRFNVAIFSSRNHQPGGIKAMHEWLIQNGLSDYLALRIQYPTDKPPAQVTLDDRAITFTGEWPEIEMLLNFKPCILSEHVEGSKLVQPDYLQVWGNE